MTEMTVLQLLRNPISLILWRRKKIKDMWGGVFADKLTNLKSREKCLKVSD